MSENEQPGPVLTPKLKKGMGHVARPYAAGTPTTRHLFGARRIGADAPVDWSPYIGQVLDQDQTQRCVGAARAQALHVLAQHQRFGTPNPSAVPFPSFGGIYTLARELLVSDAATPLADTGSSPSAADEALSGLVGVPLERDWPSSDLSRVNDRLTVEALARAFAIKLSQHYVIPSEGSERIDDSCQALSGGPFTMAIPVGPEYEGATSDPNAVVGPATKVFGMHDVCVLGWTVVRQSRRKFLTVGSWGRTFGWHGFVWVDELVVADPRAMDFSVPQVVTNWVQAAQHGQVQS